MTCDRCGALDAKFIGACESCYDQFALVPGPIEWTDWIAANPITAATCQRAGCDEPSGGIRHLGTLVYKELCEECANEWGKMPANAFNDDRVKWAVQNPKPAGAAQETAGAPPASSMCEYSMTGDKAVIGAHRAACDCGGPVGHVPGGTMCRNG